MGNAQFRLFFSFLYLKKQFEISGYRVKQFGGTKSVVLVSGSPFLSDGDHFLFGGYVAVGSISLLMAGLACLVHFKVPKW